MKFSIVYFLWLVTISRASLRPQLDSRIIGGNNASPKQFPYQVGIKIMFVDTTYNNICGGSLIANEWVMTTAFCLRTRSRSAMPKSAEVFLGDVRFLISHVKYTVGANFITTHADFNPHTMENDIGLIKIPFTHFTEYINKINLPRLDDRSDYNQVEAVLTGWGYSDSASPALILQYALFKVISNENCKVFSPYIRDAMLCVSTKKIRYPCGLDVGGPLAYDSSYGRIQIGIAGFSLSENCSSGNPYGFTRVNKFLHWIRQKTNIFIQGMPSGVNITTNSSNNA